MRPAGHALALAAMLVAGFPATALGADVASPRVIRIDPSTGAQTVLAGGAPWTRLAALAVAPSGTVYVANDRPNASGIYSLTAPGFAITPFATTVPTTNPQGLAATDSTVYSLDGAAGIVSIGAAAPFAQTVLAPRQPMEEGEPLNPWSLTLSGTNLYGVTPSDCFGPDSVGESSAAEIVRIETATGETDYPASLGCSFPNDVAVAADGSYLVAMPAGDRIPAEIIRVRPGRTPNAPVAKGGLLRDPIALAMAPSGDLIVADLTSGVLRITPQGKQSVVASGGNLNGVNGVAVDAGGAIYAIAPGGPAAVLNVSAPVRQRYSASGRPCHRVVHSALHARLLDAVFVRRRRRARPLASAPSRRLRLKFPARLQRSIAKRLRKYNTAAVTLTMEPQDGKGHALGRDLVMTVVLTRG